MSRYNDLVAGLHHYMLDSKLITKMDTMLNTSVIHKVNDLKKEVNTNPQQWEYTKKDQERMSRQKERFYFPKETDQLFWMFFVFQNGNETYELTDTSKFLIEKEKKMECITKIRENKKQLSTYKIKGIKVCKQGKALWEDTFEKRKDPLGNDYYWLKGSFTSKDEDKETDINYLENNYVTVVPSQYDMTCFESVENLKKWKL